MQREGGIQVKRKANSLLPKFSEVWDAKHNQLKALGHSQFCPLVMSDHS